uniref:EGF-like domain-containing protein n=1 Tax=Toxocara canis TaxID=6265 RepID=A0A183UWS7_TOXCA
LQNTNTFQAALFITDNGTFANFIYKNIGWTQGAETIVLQAGFNKGDGSEHFALPTSGTGNIMYLEEYGNTGIPGEWMFVLGDKRVERCKAGIKGDTCDEECAVGEWAADCALCCHCASGACNAVTGECPNGACAECWLGPPTCQLKKDQCRSSVSTQCAHNAISFTDYDRCGEPIQRCQCLTGYEGDGHTKCVDIDECAQPGTCHEKAICTNTPGRYFCQCGEGFSGDGVSECVASFLYPFEGHQALPKSKNAKVSWQLKYPVNVFGQSRDKLTISTQGLIALEDVVKIKSGQKLDTMGVHGVAPFFAPIDLSKGGQVFVDENTGIFYSNVLTRATQTITDNFPDSSFVATSVITVTFVNVTSGTRKGAGNTFQVLIIGGINKLHENITFVQMLYKDLPWSDGAEAGIMSFDESNSILLPGSGTEGIEQLSQLSNIRTPGQWLYRIDSEAVYPCTQPNLQPPYCDASSPTLVNQRIAAPPPPTQAVAEKRPGSAQSNVQVEQPSTNGRSPTSTLPADFIEVPGPRFIQPVLVDAVPNHHRTKPLEANAPSLRSTTTALKPRPSFVATAPTPHIPIVSLDSHDIEDIPPDAFDITFPPFITVVPQLFTPQSKPTSGDHQEGTPTIEEVELEPVELSPKQPGEPSENVVPTQPEQPRQPEFIHPQIEPQVPIQTHQPSSPEISTRVQTQPASPTQPAQSTVGQTGMSPTEADSAKTTNEQKLKTVPSNVSKVKPPEIDFAHDDEVVSVDPTVLSIAKPVPSESKTNSPQQATSSSKETEEAGSSIRPLFVFTTPPQTRPMPTKPKLVTAQGPTSTPLQGPFDTRSEPKVETSTSNLAVIIPTAIIAVWLLLLAVIALFCCCRKKRAERQFRELYFPNHQIRPLATGYAVRKGSKHFEGSYEDHLEKAARLSSELSAYNQNGRVSLYGSYWNLANSAGTSSSGMPSANRQSPFSQYNSQQVRAQHHTICCSHVISLMIFS